MDWLEKSMVETSEITIKYGWLVVLTILKNDGVRQ
jgi:hypothetical protein